MARIDYTKDGEKVIRCNYMPGSMFYPVKYFNQMKPGVAKVATDTAYLDSPAVLLEYPHKFRLKEGGDE